MNASPQRTPGGIFAAVLSLIACLVPLPADAEQQAPAPAAVQTETIDRAKLFDAMVEATEHHFYDDELLTGLKWRDRAAAIRPRVLGAATDKEAVRQINALLGELGVSHTALFTPDEYEYYILLDIVGPGPNSDNFIEKKFWGSGPSYPGIGVFTKRVEERNFVDGVMEGSPAATAGIKYGDELVTVDAAPYSPIAAFRGKIGQTVEIGLRRTEGGDLVRLGVPVVAIAPGRAFTMATAASARIIEANGKRIGYAHVWASQSPDGLKEALDTLGKKPLPDALIVDMRGRVGGTMETANDDLKLLADGANPYWGDTEMYSRRHPKVRTESPEWPRGRTALLIDEHTRSAGEIMAYGFKRSGFGPVIGTPTAGAVSSGQTFVMPGDFLLYLAGSRIEFDGRSLEGVGVAPDTIVQRPLPYANGADPVLDAAVAMLTGSAG